MQGHGAPDKKNRLIGGGAFSGGLPGFLTDQTTATNSARPKAYLNWILFDEQFKVVSSGSGFEQVGADMALTQHVRTDMPVAKSGYLYVFVSNETPNIDVYFDDLQVAHKRGPLLETNEYYPYGLEMKHISYRSTGTLQNRYKYNGGNELEDEGKLNYHATFFRKYDAQIGRFTGIDIYAEQFAGINPYQFGANNPVMFNDPMGDKFANNGRSTRGPDGNYHASWVSAFMWNNLGFFQDDNADQNDFSGGSGGGGNFYNYRGMSSATILDNMRLGDRFGINKKGEYGYWTTNTFDASNHAYAERSGTTLEEVVVGTNRRWVPFAGIPGLFFQFGRNPKPGEENGIKIKLGYIDNNGYSDLNWVQTVRTNQPMLGKSWQDKDGFDKNPSRYYSYTSTKPSQNIKDHTNFDGFSVDFYDAPLGDAADGIVWIAELSLVGNKDGNYKTLFTITYGFSFSPGGSNFASYISTQQLPSLFHITATQQPPSYSTNPPLRP